MKKRLLSTLLVLCMVLVLLPGTALGAETSGKCGDNVTWSYSDGVLTIQGTGDMYDYRSKTNLGFSPWYSDYSEKIHTVIINDGVTSIGAWAFASCRSLTSVSIPNSVTSIKLTAFGECVSLTGITIPDSVTFIGGWAFAECSSLASITIPDGVTVIGNATFQDCTNLTTVTIPDSVTAIGSGAFLFCRNLAYVYYGGSKSQWEQIEIDEANDALTGAGIHYNSTPDMDKDGMTWSYSDGTLTIEGTGNMKDYSTDDFQRYPPWFDHQSEIRTVKIGNGITSIGGYAFAGCRSLTSITIPDSVTSIGDNAFSDCINLTGVTVPGSVTSIGQFAFIGCKSLTGLPIGSGVTTIGYGMFQSCGALTSVTIPDGVAEIGEFAFMDCAGLTSVAIPASVTSIGKMAFSNCDNLEDVYYPGGKSQWEQIKIGESNNKLLDARLHCNSTIPGTPDTPDAPDFKIELSKQNLSVDGEDIKCEKYNINGSNYFKLRDLAKLLDGTGSQFEVGYDNATRTVTITTGAAYTPNGSELPKGGENVDNSPTAQPSTQTVVIDGQARTDLTVYNIGGSNFFQLRELGTALGFDVDYNKNTDTAIVNSK